MVRTTSRSVAQSSEGGSFDRQPGSATLKVEVLDSVAAVPRDVWERLLPGEPENWDFYTASERSPPPGFTLGALAVFAGDAIVAAAPLFWTSYRIDTALQGRVRRATDWLHARLPRLLALSVIGIGSPMSDNCALGFAPELSEEECVAAFDAMLAALKAAARSHKCDLLAVKGLDRSADVLAPALQKHGFRGVTSVPLVMLDLPYRTLEQYLDALPRKGGAYLRRKMAGADNVRIEYRSSVGDLEPRIHELFQNTLGQSKVNYGEFQDLGTGYFRNVVEAMGDQAPFMLCWKGDELLSFQMGLVGRDRLLAKQIGMQYPEARNFNLYFVNWLKLIDYAIQHRIPGIEMGATTYATKLLFGGYLERRWLHFRPRYDTINYLVGRFGKLLDFERNDPELMALDPAIRASMGPRISRLGRRAKRGDRAHG